MQTLMIFSLSFFAIFAVYLIVYCYNTRVRVNNAVFRLENDNKRSISLRKMAEVEASLSELTDAYDALLTSHKKMRSRIGMRKVREERSSLPDPQKDPAGYKRVMRQRLNQAKL